MNLMKVSHFPAVENQALKLKQENHQESNTEDINCQCCLQACKATDFNSLGPYS